MQVKTIRIDQRFQGPPTSGNGGYACGLLARHIQGPAVTVRLLRPIPLDTELEIKETDEGALLLHHEAVIAQARPSMVVLETPVCPGFEEAEAASRNYRGFTTHWFPNCFVCGPGRGPGDGLQVFAGPLAGEDRVACPWIPEAWVASADGVVAPEFVWAVLDCPGSFSFAQPQGQAIVLGEFQVEIRGDVSVGERCVLVAWLRTHQGRKYQTATALFGQARDCRALGLATFITVQELTLRQA